jgi:hypothetical protein
MDANHQARSTESKELVQRLLWTAGWPRKVGLNDKSKTSHNRFTLDHKTVHTYNTKDHGFFVFDPALGLVTLGASRGEALLAMVNRRETLSPHDSCRAPDPSNRVSAPEHAPEP